MPTHQDSQQQSTAPTGGKPVAIVTSWLSGSYWTSLIAGAAQALQGKGLAAVCVNLPPVEGAEGRRVHPISALVSAESFAGMIVVTTAALENAADDFVARRKGLASVCVGQWVQDVPSVWIQNAAGIRTLMAHLTEACGRRRIAFIRGTAANPESEARFRAWEDFCTENRLAHCPELVELGDFTQSSGANAAIRLLETGSQRPDAVVAANDLMAIGAMRALKARGLRVPDDVSVVGFDDIGADEADPPLTTVRQPLYEMGARAAQVLHAQMNGKPATAEHMFVPELVVRASCRPGCIRRPRCRQDWRSSLGAFVDRTCPSPDGVFAALANDLQKDDRGAERTVHRVNLLHRLGETLELTGCRERALIEAVNRTHLYAQRQAEQALASGRGWDLLRAELAAPLSLLGIDSLAVVCLEEPTCYDGQARILFHHDAEGADLGGTAGCWRPSSRILAEWVRRPTTSLRILKPLHDGDSPLGYVMLSGAMLDDVIVSELCGTLARHVTRLGT